MDFLRIYYFFLRIDFWEFFVQISTDLSTDLHGFLWIFLRPGPSPDPGPTLARPRLQLNPGPLARPRPDPGPGPGRGRVEWGPCQDGMGNKWGELSTSLASGPAPVPVVG